MKQPKPPGSPKTINEARNQVTGPHAAIPPRNDFEFGIQLGRGSFGARKLGAVRSKSCPAWKSIVLEFCEVFTVKCLVPKIKLPKNPFSPMESISPPPIHRTSTEQAPGESNHEKRWGCFWDMLVPSRVLPGNSGGDLFRNR